METGLAPLQILFVLICLSKFDVVLTSFDLSKEELECFVIDQVISKLTEITLRLHAVGLRLLLETNVVLITYNYQNL